MRRLERLVNLLAALIDTERPLTRAELFERVPGYASEEQASRRAFERDKETLRSMGIQLTTEYLNPNHPEDGEGYRIPRDRYALANPGLSGEEMQALAMAASAVKLKSQAATAALWKLGADLDPTSEPNVSLTDDDALGLVFSARSEKRAINFTYKSTLRTLDPHRLSFRNGHWYVNGFDHDHQDVRTYRLDRIEGEIEMMQPGSFASNEEIKQSSSPWLPAWQMGDGEPIVTRVLIDQDQASLAIDQTGESAVVAKNEDGSVVLELHITNKDAFRSFVLGFLDHAEVIEPQVMRDDMKHYLQEVIAHGS